MELQKQLQKPAQTIVEEERATLDSLPIPSEVGEVTDNVKTNNGKSNEQVKFCTYCLLSLDVSV